MKFAKRCVPLIAATAATVLCSGVATAAGSTAAASYSAIPAPPVLPATAVRGTMTVECTVANTKLVSAAALASPASVKALCAKIGVAGSGPDAVSAGGASVTPDSTVSGNCGESWVYLYSTSTSGEAQIYEGAYPWTSPILYGSADLLWQNLSKGGYQTWTNSVWPNTSAYYWAHSDYKVTKTGIVFSSMSGDVLLASGGICSISYPTDTETIH